MIKREQEATLSNRFGSADFEEMGLQKIFNETLPTEKMKWNEILEARTASKRQ